MSVVIIGGHDRMHCRYKEICKKYGCKCKVFTQFPANFRNQIGSPDMMVAEQQAEKAGTFVKHCHSSSACALNEALTEYFGGNA